MLHQSWLRAALLVAAAIVAAGSAGAYSLGAGPSRLELTVEPGRTVEGRIVVSGEFEGVTTIGAYVADWEMGPDGEAVFLPSAGRHPRSLARWLQVSPVKFQLDRNGKVRIVQYRLTLPPGSAGTYWGAIFFRDVTPPRPGSRAPGINTVGQVATIVYATTKYGGIQDGAIAGVTAEYAAGKLTMRAEIANRGNIIIRGAGRLVLQNASSKDAAEMKFGPLPVLPGSTRRITANRQEQLRPGNYLPFVEFAFGGRRLRAHGAPLQIGP